MKIAAGSPLQVSLHWSQDDVQPVGRLAYRNGVVYLEYDPQFLTSGLELSPVHHKLASGLMRSHDPACFEGLHGVFHDSLPDGWGRLLVDRRARQLNIEPATLTPLDRLACVGDRGIGALAYAPVTDIWADGKTNLDLDKLQETANIVATSFTNSVAKWLELETEPTSPELVLDLPQAVFESVLAEQAAVSDEVLLSKAVFRLDGEWLECGFYVLPTPASYRLIESFCR